MNLISIIPFFSISKQKDVYRLIQKDETVFEKTSPKEFKLPFNIISNKKIGGIKLVYIVDTIQEVNLHLFGLTIKWIPKHIKSRQIVFFKPLKQHWNRKLSYLLGGTENQPFMKCWFICNQNFTDIYKDQYYLHFSDEVLNQKLSNSLNQKCKQFFL